VSLPAARLRTVRRLRVGARWLAAMFCAAHLAFLLVHNITGNADTLASWYCTLTATSQSWGMFAPYVGRASALPVLALTFRDGQVIVLHSEVEPPLPALGAHAAPLRLTDIPEAQRVYGWRSHWGDARRRAIDGKVANERGGAAGASPLRIALSRQWLIRWLREQAAQGARLRRVDLYRWGIEHPAGDRPGRLMSIDWLMEYDPWSDPAWPPDLPLG
jgi:hypothetical protein